MKKIQIILLVIIIIGVGLLVTQKYWVSKVVDFILVQEAKAEFRNSPLNMTFTLENKKQTLKNGQAEGVAIFGEPLYGDLNGDDTNDAVMIITHNPGGSGTFFYAVAAINKNGKFSGTNAIFLGDRIAPQNIRIDNGETVVNFAERRSDEPMTAQPSIGKSVWLKYDAKTGELKETIKDSR